LANTVLKSRLGEHWVVSLLPAETLGGGREGRSGAERRIPLAQYPGWRLTLREPAGGGGGLKRKCSGYRHACTVLV
jgi:hypothetical protein